MSPFTQNIISVWRGWMSLFSSLKMLLITKSENYYQDSIVFILQSNMLSYNQWLMLINVAAYLDCSTSRTLLPASFSIYLKPCEPPPPWPPLASCCNLHPIWRDGAGLQGRQRNCTHLPPHHTPQYEHFAPLQQRAGRYCHCHLIDLINGEMSLFIAFDKCTDCKSLWTKLYAKCPKCKCKCMCFYQG